MRIAPWLVPLAVGPLFLLLASGCMGGSPPVIDCSTATVPTYDQVGAFTLCSACHNSRFTGAARQGAPRGINYDTYEAAAPRTKLTQGVIADGSMPPGNAFALTAAQEEQVYTWYQCGKPR